MKIPLDRFRFARPAAVFGSGLAVMMSGSVARADGDFELNAGLTEAPRSLGGSYVGESLSRHLVATSTEPDNEGNSSAYPDGNVGRASVSASGPILCAEASAQASGTAGGVRGSATVSFTEKLTFLFQADCVEEAEMTYVMFNLSWGGSGSYGVELVANGQAESEYFSLNPNVSDYRIGTSLRNVRASGGANYLGEMEFSLSLRVEAETNGGSDSSSAHISSFRNQIDLYSNSDPGEIPFVIDHAADDGTSADTPIQLVSIASESGYNYAIPGGPALTISPGAFSEAPGTVRISWPARAAGYLLQSSPDLRTWTNLGEVLTGADATSFDVHNGPSYFFRLVAP